MLAGALALGACTNLMFQPSQSQFSNPAEVGINVENIYMEGADGVVLHGWRLPADGRILGSILFLHGNGGNISSHIGGVYWLPDNGYEVFLFDYRGYGRSTGVAELDGVVRDAERMISYARGHAACPSHGVTVLGHSMGGSVAIYAVAETTDKIGINALITVDAFSDYRQITRDALSHHWLTWPFKWPLSFTVSNRYSPVRAIGDVAPIPVFVMHSDEDEIVPVYHADRLFAAAHQPRYRVRLKGGHNQVLALSENRKRLLEILGGLNQAQSAPLTSANQQSQ